MRIWGLLLILSTSAAFGQEMGDSTTFEAAFQWLERKLTFNYFDPTNQHWWVNRIQENQDGTYTIKNIAAKHPDKVLEKTYHNRTLFLYDLNPNAVSVLNLEKDQGRFVKGKIVRAEGFTNEKDVRVIKDGVSGSKVNFIHISVPEFLEDSVGGYAEELAKNVRKVLYLNARLYNTGNLEDNITSAFKALRGKYVNYDSTAYLDFEVVDVGLVKFELKRENHLYYGTIGFDVGKKAIYFFMAGNKNYILRDLTFRKDTQELILESGQEILHIIGRNTLKFGLEGLTGVYTRY